MAKQRLVVIGNGMAGCRAVEEILARDPDRYEIAVFGAEPRVNYNRIMLSPVLAGEASPDEIVTHDPAWYMAHGVACRFGETITRIDRATKTAYSRNGQTPYDKLVLATGSAPFIIPVAGKELHGVFSFRDLDDVNAMLAVAEKPGTQAVVLGGGLLGQRKKCDVGCGCELLNIERLELAVPHARQSGQRSGSRIGARRHPGHDLHVRMPRQQGHELLTGIPGGPGDPDTNHAWITMHRRF